ncbi:diguanylate cyclase [Sphingomonas sp. NFR15]|uniref:GGDEF domain-containing protein n=1 Tax=Sphingomonas sp. NFR15 TaxID=1566282 RepID=UPI00088B279C|nr:GGDEF domain-containing protein [Sphingomonas sp. NFR15]SDA36267.1 diguanylate cyclase (GGDEF) domain-containing protein [Sphingomonas sp. NFR15]
MVRESVVLRLFRKILIVWCAIVSLGAGAFGGPAPAFADVLRVGRPLCYAVSRTVAKDGGSPLVFLCAGQPEGYQKGTLWFRAMLPLGADRRDDLSLIVHSSRFDRLLVTFSYADRAVERQDVRSGDFGTHWRAGGQLAFRAPHRDVPLTGVTIRFDKVASAHLLRMRLVGRGEESTQTAGLAALIGAALVLLLAGAIYNASLALALRRQFSAWQAAWAICMVAWGACWSQLHLLFLPAMAGAVSAQICTFLSCLAIPLATLSAITALEERYVSRWLRRATLWLTAGVFVLGIPLSLMRSGPIDTLGGVLSVVVLANLVAVAFCIGQAWRRGSSDARSYAGAWAVPMLVLASTSFFDADAMFWGGGSQILVLFAAAWQTLWLSAAASRSHGRLRAERDMARRAEGQAQELARRDALTGLLNRRGFIERIGTVLDTSRDRGEAVALLLIDVDWFKSINDAYGHEAGDVVLAAIARCIAHHECPSCIVARLGGEEFAVMVAGLDGAELMRFAEGLRQQVRDCEHGDLIDNRNVTVSIGIAETITGADFRALYRLADEALYEAKRNGRDRVVIRPPDAANPCTDDLDQVAVGL